MTAFHRQLDLNSATRGNGALARFAHESIPSAGMFDASSPIFIARAPGRLDLMGGVADYSGSLVLQYPLGAATFVAAQTTRDSLITVQSTAAAAIGCDATVTVDAASLAPGGIPLEYGAARELLTSNPQRAWAAYALGALVVLAREHGVDISRGLCILVESSVPAGKGVSSSAALEVASMNAIVAASGADTERLRGRELALLCQRVENVLVGAPCGVMDQMTSECGEQDKLLALLCQPAELQGNVALPPSLEVWGIDSGIRHSIGAVAHNGTDFTSVRTGAFMGYRMLMDMAGVYVEVDEDGLAHADDRRWRGYLANVTPQEWESEFRDWIPESMHGASFLRRYGGTTDIITRVDPSRRYAIRHPAEHPVYEHDRVRRFHALLEEAAATEREAKADGRSELSAEPIYTALGALMSGSHASYTACGLDSDGTNLLVEMVRAAGPHAGLYGAKITGGGSGGTVAVLARRGSSDVVHGIAREYERATGRSAAVLGGSSPGAATFGIVRLDPL